MKINAQSLLLFVANHIIHAGGQESSSYLIKIVSEQFHIPHRNATYAVQHLFCNDYLTRADRRYSLTKKTCDRIREINASKKAPTHTCYCCGTSSSDVWHIETGLYQCNDTEACLTRIENKSESEVR